MKNRDKILNYFLYISLVCIGIIVGIAIRHFTNLPIGETINVIELATLVTTVFLAVYIPEVLDRKLQMTRDKKEFLERRISEYEALLRRVNMLVQSDAEMTPDNFLTVQNSLDVATGKLDSIGRLLQYSKLGDAFPKEIAQIKKLDDEHKSLLIRPHDEPITAYSAEIRESESDLYDKIDEAAALLIFKISDAR